LGPWVKEDFELDVKFICLNIGAGATLETLSGL